MLKSLVSYSASSIPAFAEPCGPFVPMPPACLLASEPWQSVHAIRLVTVSGGGTRNVGVHALHRHRVKTHRRDDAKSTAGSPARSAG